MGQGFTYKPIDNYRKMKVRVVSVSHGLPVHDLGVVRTVGYLNRSYFSGKLRELEYGDSGTLLLGHLPDNFVECELLS